MFTKTADCSQLIVEFNFFSWFLYDKNRLYSNFLSSNERFIFFNSNLVNGPDFRAHYLNIYTLLLRPHCLRWHYERVSLTSSNWRKPFFTQFEYMLNRNIDQDLVNRLFITNSLTRFLRARQLCYLLANRTATQRQHQDCRIPSFNKLKIQSKYLIVCWQGACSSHIRRTDILKKSSVDCSRIAEKSWKWKILLEVKTWKQLQNLCALQNLLERYMASSFFSLSLTLVCPLQHF